jgi:hypothetical protein
MATVVDDPWDVEAKVNGSGEDYECCPADNYPASIVGMFDVGTHDETYNGETKSAQKLVLVYELSEKRKDGKPFILAERYTFSLNKKARLKNVIEALLSRSIADGERINFRDLVSLPCMVNVGNSEKIKDGKTKRYHNILGIAKLPKGMPIPEYTVTPILWSVKGTEPFPLSADWLPLIYGQTIEDIAKNSAEAKSRRLAEIENGEDIKF